MNKKLLIIVLFVIIIFIVMVVIIQRKVENTDKLTMKIINNLVAQKKDKLSWEDFKEYKSTEIGSGLYILLYDIDENYQMMIGGVPNRDPMYIRLVSKKDEEQYIDIRYESIQQFLDNTK